MSTDVVAAPAEQQHPLSDIRLSFKELGALSSRLLRARGLPVGTLGAAVRLVELAELCDGGAGIALLERLAGDDQRLSGQFAVLEEHAHLGVCEGGGASTLLCGPPAVDWAAALADEQSEGLVLIRDVVDLELACALAVFGASHGTTVVAAGAPTGAQRAWRADRGVNCLVAVELAPELWIAEYGSALLEAFVTSPRMSWLLVGHQGGFGRPGSSAAQIGTPRPREIVPLRQHACLHGIHVNLDTWQKLTACADRTLVPTSSTSRLGAG